MSLRLLRLPVVRRDRAAGVPVTVPETVRITPGAAGPGGGRRPGGPRFNHDREARLARGELVPGWPGANLKPAPTRNLPPDSYRVATERSEPKSAAALSHVVPQRLLGCANT